MTLHHLESYQENTSSPPRVRTTLPGIGRDTTPLGIIPGNTSSPPGFELPILVLDVTLHHQESSREQLALPGFEPLHPWYFSRTVTPPGISPPAEGERSPSTPPAPFHFSSVDYERKYRSRWY